MSAGGCIECGCPAWGDTPEELLAQLGEWVVETRWDEPEYLDTIDGAWEFINTLDEMFPPIAGHHRGYRLVCPDSVWPEPWSVSMVFLSDADLCFLDDKGFEVPDEACWWDTRFGVPAWFKKGQRVEQWTIGCDCGGLAVPDISEALVRPKSFGERERWGRWHRAFEKRMADAVRPRVAS